MKAIRIDGQTPGGNRSRLADIVPLSTPFSLQVFPIYACNLACSYCIHSVPLEKRGFIASKNVLSFNLYKKVVDDMMAFPQKLKMLRLAGTGEPLLHKQIAEMVAYAKEKQIADSIDIVTNGLRLSQGLSKDLIAAGLDKLRISIQGLSDAAYAYTKEAGVFVRLIEEIKFFYNHKKDTKIYIKIIDCALQEGDEERFLDIFGDICDYIAVEHLIPAVDQIDYTDLAKNSSKCTQNGNAVRDIRVCPQPFYMMQLNPDGNIVPCCSMETPIVLGNAVDESMYAIWHGEKNKAFLLNQLRFNKNIYPVCQKCQQYKYAVFEEDVLDYDAQKIMNKL